MLVRDLIKLLQKEDQDAEAMVVVVGDFGDWDWAPVWWVDGDYMQGKVMIAGEDDDV